MKKTVNYTVANIPIETLNGMRKKAKKNNLSVNKAMIDAFDKYEEIKPKGKN
jgi:hypothetical protein